MATTPSLPILHGTDQPLSEPIPLRAGPATAALDGVDLRYVRLGDVELVRRIYVAVRDRNWNTIPGRASTVDVAQRGDGFTVRFAVRHTSDDTDFSWNGTITGDAEGRIRYEMDGRSERPMLFNRIGFCILHPWRELVGARYRGETPDGPVEGAFPRLVAPQRFENGVYVPLFPSVSCVKIALSGGEVVFEFDGDLFETEDQRNWTDASLKTYCTPMSHGFPHELREGEPRSQTVTVHPRRFSPSPLESPDERPRVIIGSARGKRMADIGLSIAAGGPPSDAETHLLRALDPAHLRHEIHLANAGWHHELKMAQTTARAIAARLELALFVAEEPSNADLAKLGQAVSGLSPARVLVALEGAQTATPQETTPGAVVSAVRVALALSPDIPVAGGTDMYFCELNRTRPDTGPMDGVFWSMNAQVHAFDDLSVMETPEAQGEQVRTAHDFAPGQHLFVGPVTLRRRYNVNATVAESEDQDGLPDSVDPRQASLMGAAWTLASLKNLVEHGVAAVTYFETSGWRGVIQGDMNPARPAQFPGRAGCVFPLFHVLADAAELRGAAVARCHGTRSLEVAALAADRADGGATTLIANLTPRRLDVALEGISGIAAIRRLNEQTAERAMREPLEFRADTSGEEVGELLLAPYETVRIDT